VPQALIMLFLTGGGAFVALATLVVLLVTESSGDETPPIPRSALRAMRDDCRSHHPRSTLPGLRGEERWL
jgi:hypothetical protein